MFDAVTYGAAVGAAKKYTDEHSGSDDAVKYTEQSLTSEQQAQARENIGAAASDDDNKLRLGQICAVTPIYYNQTIVYKYKRGFFDIFRYSDYHIVEIRFSTTNVATTFSENVYMACAVGDFMAYKEGKSSTIVYVNPTSTFLGTQICVENGYLMFCNCKDLATLDISMFDTSGCRDMSQMFYECTALTTLDISSFDMTNVIAYDKMFGEESHWAGITTLKTPKINPHDDIPLPRTLYSQDGTAYTNLPVTTGTSIELRQSWT